MLKKIILRLIFSVIAAALVFPAALAETSGAAFASPVNYVRDEAGILSPKEKTALADTLAANSERLGTRLAVAIVSRKFSQKAIGQYANQFADNMAATAKNGAIVFVQDIKSRLWYIATDKKMKPAIPTNVHVEYISKAVVARLKKNDSAGAYNAFAERAADAAYAYAATGKPIDPKALQPAAARSTQSGKKPKNAVSDSANKKAAAVSTAVTAETSFLEDLFGSLLDGDFPLFTILAVSGLLAYLYASGRSARRIAAMSNVAAAVSASGYLKQDSFKLTCSDEIFLYETVAIIAKAQEADDDDGSVEFSSADDDHGGGGGSY